MLSKREQELLSKNQELFRKAAQPLVEFIRKYYDPHTTVIVTGMTVELVQGEMVEKFDDDWD